MSALEPQDSADQRDDIHHAFLVRMHANVSRQWDETEAIYRREGNAFWADRCKLAKFGALTTIERAMERNRPGSSREVGVVMA